mmetsp:Transcript_16947/g.52619  ORF Transcript_16947/g.52619 Transcript_16947/m.52619 type:complete len:266 (+) Transcript_16947:177-974(+)
MHPVVSTPCATVAARSSRALMCSSLLRSLGSGCCLRSSSADCPVVPLGRVVPEFAFELPAPPLPVVPGGGRDGPAVSSGTSAVGALRLSARMTALGAMYEPNLAARLMYAGRKSVRSGIFGFGIVAGFPVRFSSAIAASRCTVAGLMLNSSSRAHRNASLKWLQLRFTRWYDDISQSGFILFTRANTCCCSVPAGRCPTKCCLWNCDDGSADFGFTEKMPVCAEHLPVGSPPKLNSALNTWTPLWYAPRPMAPLTVTGAPLPPRA